MLIALLPAFAFAKAPKIPELAAATSITWVGLDFSAVKIYTEETFDDPNKQYTIVGVNSAAYGFGYVAVTPDLRTYKTPADAFANLTEEWNTHFTLDVLKNLGEYLDADLKASAAKNGPTDLSTGGHFLGINGTAKETDLTQESVTAMVAKWPGGTGVGLGFIADRYSKVDELGCYWPAFYNMESHAVIWTARMCEEPSGAGYRNYWLGTAKRVAADLEDVRKKNW